MHLVPKTIRQRTGPHKRLAHLPLVWGCPCPVVCHFPTHRYRFLHSTFRDGLLHDVCPSRISHGMFRFPLQLHDLLLDLPVPVHLVTSPSWRVHSFPSCVSCENKTTHGHADTSFHEVKETGRHSGPGEVVIILTGQHCFPPMGPWYPSRYPKKSIADSFFVIFCSRSLRTESPATTTAQNSYWTLLSPRYKLFLDRMFRLGDRMNCSVATVGYSTKNTSQSRETTAFSSWL